MPYVIFHMRFKFLYASGSQETRKIYFNGVITDRVQKRKYKMLIGREFTQLETVLMRRSLTNGRIRGLMGCLIQEKRYELLQCVISVVVCSRQKYEVQAVLKLLSQAFCLYTQGDFQFHRLQIPVWSYDITFLCTPDGDHHRIYCHSPYLDVQPHVNINVLQFITFTVTAFQLKFINNILSVTFL